MKYIYLYLLTFLVFFIIDFIWLKYVASNLYASKIGQLMSSNPKLVPALIFYLIYVIGIIILAILPGYETKNLWKTIIIGALFGMIAYSTYDLTNLATLKDWPLSLTLIDIAWGTTLTVATSTAGYFIASFIRL